MFVANRMTKNPTVVTPDTGIDTAARLMKKGHFRRLPVVGILVDAPCKKHKHRPKRGQGGQRERRSAEPYGESIYVYQSFFHGCGSL